LRTTGLDVFKKKNYDEQPLKRECFHMKQKIKLWMIGTKRTEFSEDLCIGIMSGIVILGIKKINKASIAFQNWSIISSIDFFG